MPGLVGIIGEGRPDAKRSDLDRMLQSIRHEKFYSFGSFVADTADLHIGWAVHPGSFSDCMPVWNFARDIALFFYGEHYPDQDQLSALSEPGELPPGGDARLVLRLYERHGAGFLQLLNGCFHGVIADLRSNRVIVFNDRLGMQRLYYAELDGRFLFSSEAKAILRVCRDLRQLSSRGVGEFLTCGCVLENRTLFERILTLPGGSCWTFHRNRSSERIAYFTPAEWEQQSPISAREAYDSLPALVRSAIVRHTTTPLPIGVSLSGGLDTRLIMAYLSNGCTGIPTYTFSGMHRENHDVKIARTVAASSGHPHHVLSLTRGFLRDFPSLSARTVYLSDGGLGAEGAYELFFNQMARGVAAVRLTGNYGSEVFRSVRQLGAFPPDRAMLNTEFVPQVKRAAATLSQYGRGHDLSFSVFRQAPWFGHGRFCVEQSQVVIRNPFLDHEFLRYMYRVPPALRNNSDLELHTIYEGDPGLLNIPTDRAERGRYGKMSSPWAHVFTWLVFKADYCYKSGMPQWLEQIHYWFRPFTPERLVVGLHRFQYYRIWFRRELADYIRDVLLDPATKTRPYFNPTSLEHMVNRHIKGDRNYTDQIERALSLELIHRLLVERTD